MNLKWIVFCFISFLCNGLIGVMQKWHQTTEFKNELDAFLIISFVFSFICSVIMWCFYTKKAQKAGPVKPINSVKALHVLPVILMIISGLCVAVNNKLTLFLSGVMESAVFFPIVNGGGTVLILLSAIIIFKEKLLKSQWLGILFGVISIILFCIW